LESASVFRSRSVVAEVRDDASDDHDQRHDPTCRLAEIDLVDPALKADLEIDGENWFPNGWLCHFLLPFCREMKGAKNEEGSEVSRATICHRPELHRWGSRQPKRSNFRDQPLIRS